MIFRLSITRVSKCVVPFFEAEMSLYLWLLDCEGESSGVGMGIGWWRIEWMVRERFA
jgi:hypothetical protein